MVRYPSPSDDATTVDTASDDAAALRTHARALRGPAADTAADAAAYSYSFFEPATRDHDGAPTQRRGEEKGRGVEERDGSDGSQRVQPSAAGARPRRDYGSLPRWTPESGLVAEI